MPGLLHEAHRCLTVHQVLHQANTAFVMFSTLLEVALGSSCLQCNVQ